MSEKRAAEHWKNILVLVDHLTEEELRDSEYVTDRIITHADNEGMLLTTREASEIACEIATS